MKAFLYAGACAAAIAAEAFASGFTHEMPKTTTEKPLNTPYAELAETFRNPFGKVQTGCFWYWYRGNISPEGVKKDLEAMKRAGIDRPYIGDIGAMGVPRATGPVEIFSPAWEKTLAAAFEKASELDIQVGLFNGPGWSMSGGPWVKTEQAMRRFVASSLVVEGPKEGVVLPMPKFERSKPEFMRDVLAVAYPLPEGFDRRLEKKGVQIGDEKAPTSVAFESAEPFTAQGVEFKFPSGRKISGKVIVEAEEDGTWRRLCETPFSRVNGAVGFAPLAPVCVSFAPTTARRFRLTIKPDAGNKAKGMNVALCGYPVVEKAMEKSLARLFESSHPQWSEYKWPREVECAAGTALDPAKAVVLTGKVAPDGTLDWKVPAGKWVIYRFGAAPTGAKNGPAFGIATGNEVDKMSRAHVASHFDAYIGNILARTPPEHRKAIRYAILDSWEQSGQNYTDDFAEKFKTAYGYDPRPYLPTLFGMAVADRETSDRFLWDVRRLVADEVAYSYIGGLRNAANAHGLETWLENYGHWGFPGEFLKYGGQSDGVASEFGPDGTQGMEDRAASSCAHTYGKRLVWAESCTSAGRPFARGPMDLRRRLDLGFAQGVNATILHVFLQQPDERQPGVNAWFGMEFNRHNTWFEHFDLFTGYLKRCGWMLRQGLNVADVAYFIGEDAPCMTGACDPALPPGRQFDFINAEVLMETARVDERGRLVLPHGTAYEVLVLPKLETMRPEMLACVERLVHAGAFVIGPKPVRSPSLAGQPQSDAKVREIADRLWGARGKGVMAWDITLEEALKMRGSEPDVIFNCGRLRSPVAPLAYVHRTMPNADIYFISNQSGKAIDEVEVSLRDGQAAPELWDAATGERRAAEKWRKDGGRTVVTLALAQHESVFVVLPAKAGDTSCARNSSISKTSSSSSIATLTAPWSVSFQSDALHRGPSEPLVLDSLFNLSTSTNSAIKFYSGRITYKAKFARNDHACCDRAITDASGASLPNRIILDLGDVAVTAKVKVNGKYAGGVCFAPYRLDITPFVNEGENNLEIEVCNLWANRLIGDDGDPSRPTWTIRACCNAKTPLPKSGLLGPVRIFTER